MVNRVFREHKAVDPLEVALTITDYQQYKAGREGHLTLEVRG